MPYRRKDSPIWWASFTGPNGQRVRRSTGTIDKAEAKALEAKWKLERTANDSGKNSRRDHSDELMLVISQPRRKRSVVPTRIECALDICGAILVGG